MKKIMTMLAALCCMTALNATTYTGHLTVNVDGQAAEQDQVAVEVTQDADGLYTLTLNNFVLTMDDVSLAVGNIVVEDVAGVDEYGYTTITYDGPVTITAGDDPNYDSDDWLGPMLGDVDIAMTSRFTDTALNATIDISLMGQTIKVNLFGIVPVIKGDVSEDGEVSISDVNAVVDIIVQ